MTFYMIFLIFYVGADWVSAWAVLPNALSPAGTNHYEPWNLWRLLLLRIWEGGRKTNISVIFNWRLQTPDNILQSKIHCIQIASASSLPLFAMASKNISEEDSEPLAWPMWMFPYQTQCATIQQISVWAQQSPKKYLEVLHRMVDLKCSGGQVNRQVTGWRGRFGWCFLSLPGFTRKITGCTWCAKPPDIRERAERAQSWRTRSCSEIYTCIAYCMYIPVCLKIGERFSGTILQRDHQLLLGKSSRSDQMSQVFQQYQQQNF